MSGNRADDLSRGPVPRRRNVRSEQSVRKLVEAAVQALTHSQYSQLTVRSVAALAGVSPTTAYTYFPSKDALIAEIYLRLLRGAAAFTDVNDSAEQRVSAQLRELALLVADTPNLAHACTIALMANDAPIDDVRRQIFAEVGRRIAAALGPGHSPDVAATLHMVFSGAMMHAPLAAGGYQQIADQLDNAVRLIVGSTTSPLTPDLRQVAQ